MSQCYERALLMCETLLADDSLSNSRRCEVRMMLGCILLMRCSKGALSPVLRQLEKCIQMAKHVIECTFPEHPQCRGHEPYDILSKALRIRLQIGTATVDEFEYAISIGRKAVKLAPEEKKANCLVTLGTIFMEYGLAFPSKVNREQCILVFRQSSQLSSPTDDTRLISALVEAALCFDAEEWTGGIKAFTIAMEAVQHLAWLGLSVVQQHRVISRFSFWSTRMPGSSFIHAGSSFTHMGGYGTRMALRVGYSGLALEWIEQCRSIVWQRVLNLRVSMDELAGVEPTLAHRLKEISDMLQRGAYLTCLRWKRVVWR